MTAKGNHCLRSLILAEFGDPIGVAVFCSIGSACRSTGFFCRSQQLILALAFLTVCSDTAAVSRPGIGGYVIMPIAGCAIAVAIRQDVRRIIGNGPGSGTHGRDRSLGGNVEIIH